MLYFMVFIFFSCGFKGRLKVHHEWSFPPFLLKLRPTLVMKPHLAFGAYFEGLWGKHREMSRSFQYDFLGFFF